MTLVMTSDAAVRDGILVLGCATFSSPGADSFDVGRSLLLVSAVSARRQPYQRVERDR